MTDLVQLEREGQVALLTISRPEVLNAFSAEVTAAFHRALDAVDASDARVVIVTGAGERAFSAGGDLEFYSRMSAEEARRELVTGTSLTRRLETARQVVVAAVNGYALGGGTEIALACDIRIASTRAVFGLPEVTVGIFPGWGGALRLPRLIHRSLAMEVLLAGRRLDAQEALAAGLVSRLVEPAELLPTGRQLAEELLRASPLAQQLAKQVALRGQDMGLDDALAYQSEAWMASFFAEDRLEGHRAFLEKRRPTWRGR